MAEAVEEVDFSKLSIEDRCQHKNWKARVSGYESLVTLFKSQFDDKSPEFSKYLGVLRKFPVDSNAAAQEKGLQVVVLFVENAHPSISSRVASEIVSGVITKCFISPKAKTKELANDLILMYIETEQHERVMEELLKGTDNKSPKISSSCVRLLAESLKLFGPKVMKPSPLIKYILKGLEDRDKTVRDESKGLAVEIYRWIKDAFKPQLSGLKPVTLSELEAEFEKLSGERAVAIRFLRSEQQRVALAPVGDASDGASASALPPPPDEDMDPYELLEPVDILAKLPSDFYTNCESKKWQERKAALDSLQDLLTPNPKLVTGEYGDLVKVLKNFVKKDVMIVVVATAAKCMADLAVRMRKSFHPFAHSSVAIILEKFKEKKQTVVVALREAIDSIMITFPMDNIIEDINTSLSNKNPQIKTETAQFLTRQFASMHPTVIGNKKLLKALVDPLIKTLNDMDGGVRDAASESIATVMKVVGEKMMTPLINDLDALKKGKIMEFFEKATVKYPCPPGGMVQVPSNAVVRPSSAVTSKDDPSDAPAAKRPATGVTKKTVAAPPRKGVVITNKGVKTTGIKSKTDCGARKSSTPSTPQPAVSKSSLKTPGATHSSTDDLADDPPAASRMAAPKGLQRPTALAKPKVATAKSKLETGMKKQASVPIISEPLKGIPSKLGGLKRSSFGGVPQPSKESLVSQSPVSEDDQSPEDFSDEEYSPPPAPTIPVANGTRRLPVRTLTTPRTGRLVANLNRPQVSSQVSSPVECPIAQLNASLGKIMGQNATEALSGFEELKELFTDPDKAESLLSPRVDQIILQCNLQYRLSMGKVRDKSLTPTLVIKLFQAITFTLDSIFKHPVLKGMASRDVLMEMIPQLIAIIISPQLDEFPDGAVVSRSVNILATSIVVNADSTNMLSALIGLLHQCIGGTIGYSGYKFTEMVMKCIWKLSRGVNCHMNKVKVEVILEDIHTFLKAFPTEYWKADPNQPDTPFRTIKTITFQMVQFHREAMLEHCKILKDPEASELVAYIKRSLKQINKDDGKTPLVMVAPVSTTEGTPKRTSVPEVVGGLTKTETAHLSTVFSIIGSSEQETGFNQLCDFVIAHPSFNLELYLEKIESPPVFRNFVIKGINEIKDQRALEQESRRKSIQPTGVPTSPGTMNGDNNGVNGDVQHQNGSTKYEDLFPLQSATPKFPKSKLATFNRMSSIPAPSGSSYKKPDLPKFPVDVKNIENVVDWVQKTSAAMSPESGMGNLESARYVSLADNRLKELKDKGFNREESMDCIISESKTLLSEFRKKYNVTSSNNLS